MRQWVVEQRAFKFVCVPDTNGHGAVSEPYMTLFPSGVWSLRGIFKDDLEPLLDYWKSDIFTVHRCCRRAC